MFGHDTAVVTFGNFLHRPVGHKLGTETVVGAVRSAHLADHVVAVVCKVYESSEDRQQISNPALATREARLESIDQKQQRRLVRRSSITRTPLLRMLLAVVKREVIRAFDQNSVEGGAVGIGVRVTYIVVAHQLDDIASANIPIINDTGLLPLAAGSRPTVNTVRIESIASGSHVTKRSITTVNDQERCSVDEVQAGYLNRIGLRDY
jgi:hypothetical protein